MGKTEADAIMKELFTEAHKSVEKLIWDVVHRYHRKYGGDLEDLLSVANEGFLLACYTWKPERGAFTTHVYNMVRYSLLNEAKALYKQGGFLRDSDRMRDADPIDVESCPEPERFRYENFLSTLSDEAREAAEAAVTLSKDDKPIDMNGLSDTLSAAGWAAAEILRAFKELREAIL